MPPSFLEESRRAALEVYEREPVPTWRRSGFWTTTLRHLRLDELEPRRYEPVGSLEELPAVVGDALADEELGGLIVQRGATSVYSWLDPALAEQGVVLTSLEQAAEEHPELVERWYMRRLSADEGKFSAGTAALWTGGVFLYVPPEVRVENPIQTVYLIDESGTAQYAHTLGVVARFAECRVREFCLAPDLDGQALHSGAFELYLEEGAQVALAHLQDWGKGEV